MTVVLSSDTRNSYRSHGNRVHPQAVGIASVLESVILRKSLINVGRQPALQRVAHQLCEHLARREVAGMVSDVVELSQIDLADATGLSIVHVTFALGGRHRAAAPVTPTSVNRHARREHLRR